MKTISAGARLYDLHSVTGKIIQIQKQQFLNNIRQSLNSVDELTAEYSVYDRILLSDKTGKEHDIALGGFDLNCRPGHEITVLWAIQKGKESGPFIAVKVHDTSSFYYHESKLYDLHTPSSWPGVLVLAIAFIACYTLSGFIAAVLVSIVAFLFINFFFYNRIIGSGIRKFKSIAWI
jgi:hypothetical protein